MEAEAAAAAGEEEEEENFPSRKRARKRPYTRKGSLSTTFINMAQARREIVNALHLHRSSKLRNSTHHHQLMPNPQPTWSTTPPCAPLEVLEVEWFDNISASCSWWMGFLSSLDRKNGGGESAEGSGGLVAEEKTGSDRNEVNN